MPIVECLDLTKAYGKHVALNNLNLTITEGTSFGLLGENGAGKSTLACLLMGFIFPTAGRVKVLGEERVARAHARIGYALERPIFETRFSGRDYLTYLGKLAGLWGAANKTRVAELLEQVHLQEVANRAISTYSKGMLQRLAIAQALMTNPDLLILDEPTSGLDPRSQWEIRQIIAALRKRGKTVLLCSHLSRITSRSAYIRGLVIATAVLRIPLFLMLMLLAMTHTISHHPLAPSWIAFKAPPLATCCPEPSACWQTASSLPRSLSLSPRPSPRARPAFCCYSGFAAVLYSNTTPGPIAAFLSISRIPLIPLSICYSFGTTATIGWSGIGALLMMAVYVVGLTLLGEYWLRRRDLLLQ